MSDPVRKLVTCVSEKGISWKPHERIVCIGGYHNEALWTLSVNEAIKNIKSGAEQYFILSGNNKELNIIVADYKGYQYLKTETDLDSPDNLLGLPSFYGSKSMGRFNK